MVKYLARLRPAEGFLTVFLLILTMLATVWSVTGAEWIQPLPDLGGIAIAAVLTGLILAKIRVPSILLHPLGLLLGVGVVIWQVCSVMPQGTGRERFIDFVVRVNNGGYAMSHGGVSNDPLLFILFLTALTWLVAYASSWFVFRLQLVIWALVPSGVAILINLSYASPTLAPYFGLYLLSAMLLVVRVNMYAQEKAWQRSQVRFEPEVRPALYRDAFGFSALVLLLAWFVPTSGATAAAADVWQQITGPWQDAQMELNRVFGTVGGKGDMGFSSGFGKSMVLKGAIALPPRVVMTVRSTEPHYWRAVTYDQYSGHGWTASDPAVQPLDQAFATAPKKEYLDQMEITSTFRLNEIRSNSFFSGGQPVKASEPAEVETEKLDPFTVSTRDIYRNDAQTAGLGNVLDIIASTLRSNPRVNRQPDQAAQLLNDRLPSDLRVTKVLASNPNGTISDVELQRVNEYSPDVTSLRSPKPLVRGDTYTLVSLVSKATEKELRQAGTNYPSWVRERFLQLPNTLPARVGDLAKQISENAANPYDKAVAVESYLRALKYNEKIKSPPPTEDAVDYFLFTMPEGYCDYFSSAMVVMLRSIGIPARVAAGYSTGDYDNERDAYVVRGYHAHSWVEAYFPDYGWIEFEPTPIRDRIVRPEGTPEPALQTYQFPPSTDNPLMDLPQELFPDGPRSSPSRLGTVAPSSTQVSVSLLLGLAAVAVALALVVAFWRRGLAGLALVPQTYEKMCRFAGLARLAPRTFETPEEYGYQLTRRLPESAAHIDAIVSTYVRHRFGGKAPTAEERSRIQQAWRQVRLRLLWTLRWRRARD